MFFFYYVYQGVCEYTVTEIGPMAKEYYDNAFDSTMYIQSTWDSHLFYINRGYYLNYKMECDAMNKNVTVQEQKSKKKGLFVRSHLFVRLSFIFGIVSILLSVVHVLIAGILAHFGIWPGNLIASIITALAIAGIVLGGIALRDGINVYAILGLILSLIALAFQVWSYYITNVSF